MNELIMNQYVIYICACVSESDVCFEFVCMYVCMYI